MPNGVKKKIVIIGGGAAGVFTAYLLQRRAKDHFDITILEKNTAIGGHAHSVVEGTGANQVLIDHGAQFFSEEAQPQYFQMLEHEGLFDVPGLITKHDAGITLWHATDGELLFRIPNNVLEIVFAAALGDIKSWILFIEMTVAAKSFWNDSVDWNTTFKQWVDGLDFWFVTAADMADFKARIVRPLMYQFGLVAPDRLDELSARFVLFYFLGSLPQGLDLTPFTVYNSSEGLEGIHERLLETHGPPADHIVVSTEVELVKRDGDKTMVTVVGGSVFEADEVVFAINPSRITGLLASDDDHVDLISVLTGMEFIPVTIRIQHPTSSYMPTNQADWSVSNVIVVDNDPNPGPPTNYMLTVWFGPLREGNLGNPYFKSWGSPALDPAIAPVHKDNTHELMVGTPQFIENRTMLRDVHQGQKDLWYVGGYIMDYDTQNSALRSADVVVTEILNKHEVDGTSGQLRLFMLTQEASAAELGEYIFAEPQFEERSALLDGVRQSLVTFAPHHPTVESWKTRRPVARNDPDDPAK